MSKQKIIAMVLGIALVGGAAVFFLKGNGTETFKNFPLFNSPPWKGGDVEGVTPTQPSPPSEGGETAGVPSAGGGGNYVNPSYGFSLNLPDGFTTSEIPEEQGMTILVNGGGQRKEFQIFISAFDEPGPITAERIKQDLPKMAIESAQQVLIGDGKKITALIFMSRNESLGKTREVWFVWPPEPQPHGNYLYQITTYEDADSWIGPILETLKFQ